MSTVRPNRLLITAAAGKTGLAAIGAIRALQKGHALEASDAGEPGGPASPASPGTCRIRALARNHDQQRTLEAAGAHETALGDLNDPKSLEAALQGTHCVYHICPNVNPEEASIGRRVIALARKAGVHRIVFHSVLQPRIRAMPHHWAKATVEKAVAESGLEFTILQPAPYMQNLLGQRERLVEEGVYAVPYGLTTRVSMVDLDDVAAVAAGLLVGPHASRHAGATYELCAPGLLDQTEIAATLSQILGREIRAEIQDRKAWAHAALRSGLSSLQVETLVAMFRYYESFGMTGPAGDLQTLLGKPGATFAEFAQRVLRPEFQS